MVTGKVPNGVVEAVETVKLTTTGSVFVGDTGLEGWKLQAAPVGKFEHDSATEPVKLPAAKTEREAADVVPPGATLSVVGMGALNEKSTICKLSKKS